MRLVINTSSRAASLKRVANDIAYVAEESGFDAVTVLHAANPLDPRVQDATHVITVMVFDPVVAISFFHFTWQVQKKGKRTLFYATVEGRPKVGTWSSWIVRDMGFVACSGYVAKKLREVGARVKGVVPHGVDVDSFAFSEKKRMEFREAIGVGEDEFLVGYVAGWYKRKGHGLFAEVIKATVEEDPSVRFVVVTSEKAAPVYAGVPNTIVLSSFGQEEFDITYVYSGIDLYCQASLSEGFGLPVLEALAAGRPVVHPDYNPLSEITTPETSIRVPVKEVKLEIEEPTLMSGITFEMKYYDPFAMARAILSAKERIQSGDGEEWSRLCVERAKTFDRENVYKQLLSLF